MKNGGGPSQGTSSDEGMLVHAMNAGPLCSTVKNVLAPTSHPGTKTASSDMDVDDGLHVHRCNALL